MRKCTELSERPMANWHYYNEDGEKVGPVTGRQLKKLATHGIVAPGTVVETEDGRTGLAKNVEGLTFVDSALKLESVLRPHNEVGVVPLDTGEVYDLTAPPEPSESSDEPSLILVSESVAKDIPAPTPFVENTSSSSTGWTAPHWDWESLWNRSILSLFLLLFLMAVVAFAGLRWYIPGSPQQQQAVAGDDAEQQRQNVEARDRQVVPSPFADIFEAAARGTVEDIRFFLDRRNVNQTDDRGWTPLHYAAEHNPNVEVMRFLIAQGADVKVRNNEGWTPLDIAQRDEIRIVLREAGAIPYQSPFENIFEAAADGTVQDVAFFVKNGANVNAKNDGGSTPLLHAAYHNSSVEVIKYLVSQGADVNVKNNHDYTPLHEVILHSGNVEVLEYLVSQGADVNVKNNNGYTALHFVVMYIGNVEVLKHLISQGADVNVISNWNTTPLDLARERNKTDMIQYLESVGSGSGQ